MKITVVVRTHSRPEFLKEALSSVSMQTHKDWELILFDDSGNEENFQIFRKFKLDNKDNRCLYQTGMQNYHLFKLSWKYTIPLSSGDICIRLDDDDILLPNTLEYINEVYEINGDLDFTYGSAQFFDEQINQKTIITRSPTEMRNTHAWAPYLIPNNNPWNEPYCWWTDVYKDSPQPYTSIVHASRSNQLCVYHLYTFRISSVAKVLDKITITSTMADDLEFLASLDYLYLTHCPIKDILILCRIHSQPRVTDLTNTSDHNLGWIKEVERVRNKLDGLRPSGFYSRIVPINSPKIAQKYQDLLQVIGNQWIMAVKNKAKSY